jgi:hypothetical protein
MCRLQSPKARNRIDFSAPESSFPNRVHEIAAEIGSVPFRAAEH